MQMAVILYSFGKAEAIEVVDFVLENAGDISWKVALDERSIWSISADPNGIGAGDDASYGVGD